MPYLNHGPSDQGHLPWQQPKRGKDLQTELRTLVCILYQSGELCHKPPYTSAKLGLHLLNYSRLSMQKLNSSCAVTKATKCEADRQLGNLWTE